MYYVLYCYRSIINNLSVLINNVCFLFLQEIFSEKFQVGCMVTFFPLYPYHI